MSQLYIPVEKEMSGPWFLDIKKIEELDEIFEFAYLKILSSFDTEIKDIAQKEAKRSLHKGKTIEEIEAELYEKYRNDSVKEVVLISGDDKKLIDKSLKGLLRDSKLNDFSPVELSLNIEYKHTNRFHLTIKRKDDTGIKFNANCYDQDCLDEIKYRIENWLDENKPKRILRIWNQFSGLIIIVSVITILISSLSIVSEEKPDYKKQYKNEIQSLIENGLREDEQTKVIELIAKYEIGYIPKDSKSVRKVDYDQIRIVCVSSLFFVFAAFRPKTTLGIGRHRSLIKFYNFYIYVMVVIIPATFIFQPLLEKLRLWFSF